MRIIKNNRKVFVGVIIGAALIAIIPTILVYMLSKMSIGIEVGDSMEVVEEKINTYFEENIIGNVNAISEFQIAFNRGNIISMPMEFTQIIGLTDISHIYSYNYDFNLMKKITLNDIFKQDIDFEKIIESYVMEEIYEILDNYKSNMTYGVYELMMEAIYICDDPVFYFNGRELVICISSFELTSQVDNLIEFPISFKKIKNILSDYALRNIYLY